METDVTEALQGSYAIISHTVIYNTKGTTSVTAWILSNGEIIITLQTNISNKINYSSTDEEIYSLFYCSRLMQRLKAMGILAEEGNDPILETYEVCLICGTAQT